MNQHLNIICTFKAEVFNSEGVTFSTGEFNNTVLDNGLLKLYDYSLSEMTKYVNIGNSNVDATSTQTGLLGRLYSCNTVFNGQEGPYSSLWPVCRGYTRVLQFAIGTCTGDFFEVGLSRLSNSDYFNRQKFKNSANQEILVRVKSDEGLRVTCNLKIAPDTTSKVYSQVYKLDLNGNTAGDITFSNGTTNRTLTYAQLTVADTAKLELETLLGTATLTNCILVSGSVIILGHPMNLQSLNLNIDSHTMTGGSGPPILIIEQNYTKPTSINSFDFYDGAVDQTIVKNNENYWVTYHDSMNMLTMKLPSPSGNQYIGWGYIAGTDLTAIPFKNLYPRVVRSDGTVINANIQQTIKVPAIGDFSWVKRCYYSTGSLGTGDQIVSALTIYWNSYNNGSNLVLTRFGENMVIADNEEFEFNMTFSWGRLIS